MDLHFFGYSEHDSTIFQKFLTMRHYVCDKRFGAGIAQKLMRETTETLHLFLI